MSQPPTSSSSTAPAAYAEAAGHGLGLPLRSFVWSTLLSVVILVVIGYFTLDAHALRDAVRTLSPWWLALAVATVGLRVVFGAWRLQYLSDGRLSFLAALRGQLAWDFFSNITPSVIGGAPFASVYIARESRQPVGDVTAFMLFAMLLDQIWFALSVPVVLTAATYLEVIPSSIGTVGQFSTVLYFLGFMAWTVFFGYATLFRPDVIQRVAGRLFSLRGLRRFRQRVLGEMDQLRHRARIIRAKPPSFFAKGFLLTLGTWIPRYLLLVFIVASVYPLADMLLVFMRTAALTLGALILPTPGGSGGIEGLYFLFLGPPLMPKALVVPTLLTWRILGYYLFLGLGIFLTTHHVQQTLQRRRASHQAEAEAVATATAAVPAPPEPVVEEP